MLRQRFSVKFVEMLKEQQAWKTLDAAQQLETHDARIMIKKMPTYHVIIMAKNEMGRVNLYRLVSWSHIDYFARSAQRIPKSLLNQYREGLTHRLGL